MRPLARKATIAHVEAIVGRVHDNRIVRQSLFLQSRDKTTYGSIDSADHTIVGADIRLVLFRSIPTPEIAFAIDGGFQEIRLGLENGGIVQSRWCDFNILIHAVHRSRPREVTDSWAAIAVLRMTSIEPHVNCKGLALGLRFDELDPLVDDQLRLMAQAAVGHLLVERIPKDRFVRVEVILGLIALGHLRMPLAEVARAIASLPQQIGVKRVDGIRSR